MLISSRPGSPAAVQGISPAAVCRPVLPGFGIFPFNVGGASCGRHGPRKAGGSGDPPLRGNFGPERCDGHRSHGTAPVPPEPNGAVKNAVGAALCGRPFPVAGRFPPSRRGGLAPPAGFRNCSIQRWGDVLRGGAPGRCALRTSWSMEGGRVRRAAPTGQFRSWAIRWPPQP